eukprot:3137911-Rhodomonas_salina.2
MFEGGQPLVEVATGSVLDQVPCYELPTPCPLSSYALLAVVLLISSSAVTCIGLSRRVVISLVVVLLRVTSTIGTARR